MKKLLTKAVGHYLNALSVFAPTKAGREAFKIFCSPMRSPLKQHQKEFLATAEPFHLHQQEVSIRGYRWGHGPKKVLFLHGWQSHSFRWKKYIQALSPADYTLYAIDAPGHGLSGGKFLTVPLYSQVIEQAFQQLGPMDAVVSHSLGSFSLLHALHHVPDLPTGKLVIMGSPGEVGDFISFYQKTLRLTDRTVSIMQAHFEKTIGKSIAYYSLSRYAPTIAVPGLIIHDKADDEAPYHYALQMSKLWKKSILHTTEGLTHNLRSAEVVQAVVKYLEGKEEEVNSATASMLEKAS